MNTLFKAKITEATLVAAGVIAAAAVIIPAVGILAAVGIVAGGLIAMAAIESKGRAY